MDRGSNKHSPRVDDQLEHEVRGIVQGGVDSHTDESRDPEPSGEDQPQDTWEGSGERTGGAPPGMTYQEVEARSDLGRFIPMHSLPGKRAELIAGARDLNAPDSVLGQLGQLPEDTTYQTVSEIWAALGHHNEAHRT
jgi:hypothetical protein